MLGLFLRLLDQIGFEGVLGRASVVLVKDAEGAGPRLLGELEGRDLVGDVVAVGVLGGAVVFLLFDRNSGATLAGIRGIEGSLEEFDALGQDLDDRKPVVLGGAEHRICGKTLVPGSWPDLPRQGHALA